MSVWRLTSSNHSRDALLRQLLSICLLGLGAGIIFWLSGGIPPKTWRVLLQSSLHLSTVLAQQGTGGLISFFILVVQSVLVGIAWAVFGWLAYREGSALLALLTSQQAGRAAAKSPHNKMVATSQSSRPALMAPGSSSTQSGPMKQASSNLRMDTKRRPGDASFRGQHKDQHVPISSEPVSPFAPSFNDNWFLPADQMSADSAVRSDTSSSHWIYEDSRIKNPFEDEAAIQQKSLELKSMVAPTHQRKDMYIPPIPIDTPQPPTGVQHYYSGTDQFIGDVDAESLRPTTAERYRAVDRPSIIQDHSTIEELPGICDEGDFAALLASFNFLPQQVSAAQDKIVPKVPSAPRAQPPAEKKEANPFDVQGLSGTGENFVLGNPFKVQEESLAVFASEPSPKDVVSEQAPAQNTSEQGFLFGNPFDGPLPEVFQHDEELKQSIAAQSKTKSVAPPSNSEEEPENSDDKPARRKRSRGKRGKGASQASQKAQDQSHEEQ